MLGQNKTSNKQGQFITSGGSDEGFAHNGSKTSGNDTDPKRWKVLMYQIPVPLGDCSIYVLMYDNIIQNCFIMDGGTTSGGVHADEQIKTAWKAIKEELKGNVSRTNKKQNPSPLRFDSWVVTHWDQDHWRGVADLVGEPQGKNNVSDIEDYFTEERTIISGATCDAYLLKKSPGKIADSPNPNGQDELEKYGFMPNDNYLGKNLTGRDLFCPKDKCKQDTSGKLIWEGDQGRPRFVCLGAGGYCIGQNKAFKVKPSRNETSILSLLYWPSTNRGSYWTGGDGFPSLTEHLAAKFFKDTGLFHKPIKVVKLDHHGSSREFSNVANTSKISATFLAEPFFTMTVSANPSKIIVTPGDDYGHPCWDVILFLYCWDQDRKAKSAADHVAATNKSPSKKSKAADKSDPRLENLTVVPNCADLLYTTKTPYWIANLKIGNKDTNTTDGRVTLADKMIEDYLMENNDVTMLEMYQELWLTPRKLDHRLKPDMDPKDKRYKGELEKPEPDDVLYDREDIEHETRDNLADMTCEWWNWLSRQFVRRAQSGLVKGTDKFYMLKMTSVVDEAADGDIKVLTPRGEPDPLTRPFLEPTHRMMTRRKLAESKKDKKTKMKEEWMQLKYDKLDVDDGLGYEDPKQKHNKNPDPAPIAWNSDIAKDLKKKIPQENYTKTDSELKGYYGGIWADTLTTDPKKMKLGPKQKIEPEWYEGLVAYRSGLGDDGESLRQFVEQLEEDAAKHRKAKDARTKKGGKGGKGAKAQKPIIDPQDPRITALRPDGTMLLEDASDEGWDSNDSQDPVARRKKPSKKFKDN